MHLKTQFFTFLVVFSLVGLVIPGCSYGLSPSTPSVTSSNPPHVLQPFAIAPLPVGPGTGSGTTALCDPYASVTCDPYSSNACNGSNFDGFACVPTQGCDSLTGSCIEPPTFNCAGIAYCGPFSGKIAFGNQQPNFYKNFPNAQYVYVNMAHFWSRQYCYYSLSQAQFVEAIAAQVRTQSDILNEHDIIFLFNRRFYLTDPVKGSVYTEYRGVTGFFFGFDILVNTVFPSPARPDCTGTPRP